MRTTHWGEWIRERVRFVGFRSSASLALALGCTQHQLARWMQMEEPPTRMRKGFDASLARALRVDMATLFVGYRNVSPEAARLTSPDGAEDFESLKRKAHAVVELLDGEALRELHDCGRALLKQGAAASAA